MDERMDVMGKTVGSSSNTGEGIIITWFLVYLLKARDFNFLFQFNKVVVESMDGKMHGWMHGWRSL
jgi:hypothetical protein